MSRKQIGQTFNLRESDVFAKCMRQLIALDGAMLCDPYVTKVYRKALSTEVRAVAAQAAVGQSFSLSECMVFARCMRRLADLDSVFLRNPAVLKMYRRAQSMEIKAAKLKAPS